VATAALMMMMMMMPPCLATLQKAKHRFKYGKRIGRQFAYFAPQIRSGVGMNHIAWV